MELCGAPHAGTEPIGAEHPRLAVDIRWADGGLSMRVGSKKRTVRCGSQSIQNHPKLKVEKSKPWFYIELAGGTPSLALVVPWHQAVFRQRVLRRHIANPRTTTRKATSTIKDTLKPHFLKKQVLLLALESSKDAPKQSYISIHVGWVLRLPMSRG